MSDRDPVRIISVSLDLMPGAVAGDLSRTVQIDEYGIGYTPFFYCTAMVRDLMQVDMLSIDGVAPSKESLRSNQYPFVSSIYAAVRKTEDHKSMAYRLYQFLFTRKGADMIDESGYIAIR